MGEDKTSLPDMRTRELLRKELREFERHHDEKHDAVVERVVALETKTEAQAEQITTLFQFHNDAARAANSNSDTGEHPVVSAKAKFWGAAATALTVIGTAVAAWFQGLIGGGTG